MFPQNNAFAPWNSIQFVMAGPDSAVEEAKATLVQRFRAWGGKKQSVIHVF
jgi:hypothetical protein